MSSYVGPAQAYQYQLPFASEAIPSSFKSNLAPRPVNCSLTSVVVPATSGSANANGLSTIQVPLGNGAYMVNPYLRFKLGVTAGGNASSFTFKGACQSATACIASYQTTVNSTIVDNITNCWQVYDNILAHGTSNDWLSRDATVLMGASQTTTQTAGGVSNEVYVVPLLGLLGSQQSLPLYLLSGILQININWNSIAGSVTSANLDAGAVFTFSEVSLVYDRVSVESDFISKMRADMMASNAKYVFNYTNYQNVTAPTSAGQITVNTGLNVSSLRGLVATQVLTADLTTLANSGYSLRNGLSAFIVTLDGRILNNSQLDAVNAPAVCFAELQKCYNKVFDASVTDISTKATYLTQSFAAGVSASRVAEGLAFQGSPASVVGVQATTAAANYTLYLIFISDYSIVISADGGIDLIR
jgi:hypothetical protein